ncbi:hypothetical protein MMC18_004433 [Xylographa bjoerkii]|nr:hypothetical protein [Xylographa bjoerkii]
MISYTIVVIVDPAVSDKTGNSQCSAHCRSSARGLKEPYYHWVCREYHSGSQVSVERAILSRRHQAQQKRKRPVNPDLHTTSTNNLLVEVTITSSAVPIEFGQLWSVPTDWHEANFSAPFQDAGASAEGFDVKMESGAALTVLRSINGGAPTTLFSEDPGFEFGPSRSEAITPKQSVSMWFREVLDSETVSATVDSKAVEVNFEGVSEQTVYYRGNETWSLESLDYGQIWRGWD